MRRTFLCGTILSFAVVSAITLHAQCGQPDFACSGNMTCDCNGNWQCDGVECALPPPNNECPGGSYMQCTWQGWQCVSQGSPIIIDTKGEGYHLTSLQGGVKFAFFPGKAPVQISWTDSVYSNGFLVLDRNGDGVINDGSELFGTETPQPPTTHPNGFNALAVYDLPANGGNGNGEIDPGDAIFAKLKIWIDANHNGVSDPGELHSLKDLGIAGLSLKYHADGITDQYGNRFRDTADYTDSAGNQRDRLYDVLLLLGPSSTTTTAAKLAPVVWRVPKSTMSFDRIQFQHSRRHASNAPVLLAGLNQADDQAPRWGYEANVSRSGSVVSLHANGPRPMRDVVQALSQEYGWTIDYEDPVYRIGSDTSDATAPEWKQKHPNGPTLIVPRGGEFIASLDEGVNSPDNPDSRLRILNRIVGAYAGSSLPGSFHVEAEDSSHLAIVGIASGSGATRSAFLDTPVSLSSQPRTADQAIQEVLDAASSASGIRAMIASGPFYFSTASVVPSGTSMSARNQLRQILNTVGPTQYYWSLLFDTNTGTYHFNVAPVVKKVTAPDGHVMLVRVPR